MFRNRPLVNAIAGFLGFLAFVCLLLCTVSTPIVKGIWLFQVSAKATNLDARVSFGVFGGCGTTANFRSAFGSNAPRGQAEICTPTELSYEILTREMYQQSSNSYTSREATLVDHNTTSALILNPIAAGLAGLAMILACVSAMLKGRVMHGLSAGVLSLAALMSWAAWGINLAITIIVQRHVSHRGSVMGTPSSTNNVKFQWGAVMPLALIAALLLSVAVVFSVLSFFLGSKKQSSRHYGYGSGVKEGVGRGSTSSTI